jgi:hypothetical protein
MADENNNDTPENNDASKDAPVIEVQETVNTQENRPENDPTNEVYPSGVWMRALHMIIFMALFGVAEGLLFFMALFQFFWMLFTKKRNPSIAQFGNQISEWLRAVGRFQSGATDDKPFPWSQAH